MSQAARYVVVLPLLPAVGSTSFLTMTMQTQRALDDLSWHWGEAYDLAVTRSGWVAKRLDNGRALVASRPDGLRELIIEDYATQPVSREAVS